MTRRPAIKRGNSSSSSAPKRLVGVAVGVITLASLIVPAFSFQALLPSCCGRARRPLWPPLTTLLLQVDTITPCLPVASFAERRKCRRRNTGSTTNTLVLHSSSQNEEDELLLVTPASVPAASSSALSSLRNRLRTVTGFSWTALRATLRAATGVSLTALYAATLAATGAWIRQTMRVMLGIFPTWFRFFWQPLLILYYVPLFVVRNLTGPTRAKAKEKHELFVEGWKHAVQVADETTSGWPLHVVVPDTNATNTHDNKNEKTMMFEADFREVDVNEAVVEAVQISLEAEEQEKASLQ